MTDDLLFRKMHKFKNSHVVLAKFMGAYNFREFERDIIILLSYRISEAFSCTKGLYKTKNLRESFFEFIIALLQRRY